MEHIQKLINDCHLCGNLLKLEDNSLQIGNTPFIVIGESPAKDGWIVSKKAFYNYQGKLQASGRILEKLLNNIGISIDDIYFTELCKCIIEDRKLLSKCSSNCLPILEKQLNSLPCSIIITMGSHPTQTLLNNRIKKFGDYVGKIFDRQIGNKQYKLIPIYHPSPLNPKGYKDNIKIFDVIKNVVYENCHAEFAE